VVSAAIRARRVWISVGAEVSRVERVETVRRRRTGRRLGRLGSYGSGSWFGFSGGGPRGVSRKHNSGGFVVGFRIRRASTGVWLASQFGLSERSELVSCLSSEVRVSCGLPS
jgi:hypothetical protein